MLLGEVIDANLQIIGSDPTIHQLP